MSRDQPNTHPVSRRQFLRASLGAAVTPGMVHIQQDSLSGGGARGMLRDPVAAGRPRAATDRHENDAEIQAIEQRLACNCGCTLDVFTCRTTDFSCTYSPALHREVLALRAGGKTAQEILDAFVEKYGEKALMAPRPRGFNLTGYVLPGVLIAAAGAGLVLFIGRRKAEIAAVAPNQDAASQLPTGTAPEELERLRRALAELED